MKEFYVIKLGKMFLKSYDSITHDTQLVINLTETTFFCSKEKAEKIADRIGGVVMTFREVEKL